MPAAILPEDRTNAAATAVEEPPVRLVGLVRRGGRVQVALAVNGEVVLAAQGDSVGGFTVLAIDEDGARVRGRDGREFQLTVP